MIEIKCNGCKFLDGTVYDPRHGLFGGMAFCNSEAWNHSTDKFLDFENFMLYEREFECPFRKEKV